MKSIPIGDMEQLATDIGDNRCCIFQIISLLNAVDALLERVEHFSDPEGSILSARDIAQIARTKATKMMLQFDDMKIVERIKALQP